MVYRHRNCTECCSGSAPNQFEESAEVEAADIFMWLLTRLRRDRGAVGTVE